MKPNIYAATLNSWLLPGVIARVASSLEHGEPLSEPVRLRLTSVGMESAAAAGLDTLSNLYLSNFHISPDLIQVAKLYLPSVSGETWEKLELVRFNGEVRYDIGEIEDGRPVVIEVNASEQEARLVWWPLHTLTDIVGQLAVYWRSVREKMGPLGVHHEHRCEWQFLAYIDVIVAQAHGFKLVGRAAVREFRQDYDVVSIGRFCTARGSLPLDPIGQEQLRVIAELVHKDFHSFFDPFEPTDA